MYRLYLFFILMICHQLLNGQCLNGDVFMETRMVMYDEEIYGDLTTEVYDINSSTPLQVTKLAEAIPVSVFSSNRLVSIRQQSSNDNICLLIDNDQLDLISPVDFDDEDEILELMCYYHLNRVWQWMEARIDSMPFSEFRFDSTLKNHNRPGSWVIEPEDKLPLIQFSTIEGYNPTASEAFAIINAFFRLYYELLSEEQYYRIQYEGIDYALANYFAFRYVREEGLKELDDYAIYKYSGLSDSLSFGHRTISMDLWNLIDSGNLKYFLSDNEVGHSVGGQEKSETLSACLWAIANELENDGLTKMDNIIMDGMSVWNESLGVETQIEMAVEIYKFTDQQRKEGLHNITERDLCIMFEVFQKVYGSTFRELLNIEYYATCLGYKKIPIVTYYDIDADGLMNNDDYFLSDILVDVSSGLSFISINNDRTLLTKEVGELQVEVKEEDNPQWTVTTLNNYLVTLDSTYTADTLWFGLRPKNETVDASVYLSGEVLRCNESSSLRLVFKNNGNVPLRDIEVNVQFAEELERDDIEISENQLKPGESIFRNLSIIVPGPEEFTLGESLSFEASVTYVYDDEEYTNNTEYSDIVVCSYDPNDKLVNPNREGSILYEGEPLHYTIRFQNTGNAEAYQVEVRDTLDSNLDWSTMRILASSHSDILSTTITDDGAVSFLFADIFLPDSLSNPEGSQGYVAYEIQQKQGLSLGTEINNTASIYFDYNPPIVTNTTQSILSAPNAVEEVEGIACFYPNPNAGELLHIQLDDIYGEATVEIYSIKGDYITGASTDNITEGMDINVSSLSVGTYLVLVRSEAGVFREVLVKR